MDEAEEAHEGIQTPDPYIVAVDIGTTSVRSHIYTQHGTIKGSSSKKVNCSSVIPQWHKNDTQNSITSSLFKESVYISFFSHFLSGKYHPTKLQCL